MVVEHFAADAELLRDKSDRGDAAAFAVAAVVHLAGRLVNMLARAPARCSRNRPRRSRLLPLPSGCDEE